MDHPTLRAWSFVRFGLLLAFILAWAIFAGWYFTRLRRKYRQRPGGFEVNRPDQPCTEAPSFPQTQPAIELLTVTQAANAIDVPKGQITKLCDKGRIMSTGRGRQRRIDANSLARYKLQLDTSRGF